MKLITREIDYAVRALCFMAKRKNKLISASELVGRLDMPRPFLRKILQILREKGFIKSYKGPGGGFILAYSPHNIFLADIIQAFGSSLNLDECFFKKNACHNRRACILKRKIDRIKKHISAELKAINVACLCRKK